MRIEHVDIVEAESPQALVATGEDVLAAAPFTIRAFPHQVAGLGRDDDLVAMRGKFRSHHLAEQLFGRAGRRTVIVGEIEMGDAGVKRRAQYLEGGSVIALRAEILPQAKADRRQLEPGSAGIAILHDLIAVRRGAVSHVLSCIKRRHPPRGGMGWKLEPFCRRRLARPHSI
jgi:hypothetical protein